MSRLFVGYACSVMPGLGRSSDRTFACLTWALVLYGAHRDQPVSGQQPSNHTDHPKRGTGLAGAPL